jgi:formate-nitrite transporter family protein
MAAPTPEEIYERAEEEGARRLDMPLLEQVATGFIAGVTIIFGMVALAVVEGLIAPDAGSGVARIAGALAFGIGFVFLVVGRSELFTENFFDPVAAAIDTPGNWVWVRLLRLWFSTLLLNLVGGALLVGLLTVDGALPPPAVDTLVGLADEIAANSVGATLARSVLAGALITLLSYLVAGTNSVTARIIVAYLVGFFVALGPFDHVVVSALHLLFGVWLGGSVTYADVLENLGLATVGNLAGGLLLVTLTHTAQVKSHP